MENGASGQSFLLFYISDALYMVPVENIAAISALPELTIQVPRSPPYVYGVCSFKGENCTIVDLDKLLERHCADEKSKKVYRAMIVLEHRLALLVEQIVGVEAADDFLLLQRSGFRDNDCVIRNVYRPSTNMWDFKLLKNADELVFELDIFQLESKYSISQPDHTDISEASYGGQ